MGRKNVLIIGGGIAGLTAAWLLSRGGTKVTVLEARPRFGGRIHTFTDDHFGFPVEAGAEFIHGKMPYTFSLLKEFKIDYSEINGDVWQVEDDDLKKNKQLINEHHSLLEKKLNELKDDETVKQFLNKNFPQEEYDSLYTIVKAFVEGYDAADIEYASALHFKKEWLEVERWEAYRITGGYGELIKTLEQKCIENGCFLYPSTSVTQIKWRKNLATAVCAKGKVYTASKIIVTVPLSILQQEAITFFPVLQEKLNAAQQLRFGHVVKLQLLFREQFWASKDVQRVTKRKTDKLFFLFSQKKIPTWWTQYPEKHALLTGWLAGPSSVTTQTEEQLLNESLNSLAVIFKTDASRLQEKLATWKIIDWNKDPFSSGAYVYPTVNQEKYIEILMTPVEKTIYFAGEVFGTESGVGLVESAIESAYKVAQKIVIDS